LVINVQSIHNARSEKHQVMGRIFYITTDAIHFTSARLTYETMKFNERV